MSDVTRILSAIEEGDPHAAEQLLPLVYDELRGWQPRRWRGSNPGKRSKPRPWSMRRTCGWWTYTRRSTGTAAGTSSRRRPKPCGAAKVIGLLEFQTAVAETFAVEVRILVPQLKKRPLQQGVAAALLFFTSANL
jgi:ECF sigma factor